MAADIEGLRKSVARIIDPYGFELRKRGHLPDRSRELCDIALTKADAILALLPSIEALQAENERLRTLAESYGAEIAHLENGVAMYEAGILTQDRLDAEAERDVLKARVDALEAGLNYKPSAECLADLDKLEQAQRAGAAYAAAHPEDFIVGSALNTRTPTTPSEEQREAVARIIHERVVPNNIIGLRKSSVEIAATEILALLQKVNHG